MTTAEMVATSSTRTLEELGRMLTELRRRPATLKADYRADYREAQRSVALRRQCQTLSDLASIADSIDLVEAEHARR